jgi:hypothetical protein
MIRPRADNVSAEAHRERFHKPRETRLRRRHPVISLLHVMITQHLHAIQLRSGQGPLVSNSRWLHGRDRSTGPRVMLPILDDASPALVSSRIPRPRPPRRADRPGRAGWWPGSSSRSAGEPRRRHARQWLGWGCHAELGTSPGEAEGSRVLSGLFAWRREPVPRRRSRYARAGGRLAAARLVAGSPVQSGGTWLMAPCARG